MIKDIDEHEYRQEVKSLGKKFKFMQQYYIRIVYEFCEYEAERTYKILSMLQGNENPLVFVKYLVDNPQESEKAITELQNKFNKIHAQNHEMMAEVNLSEYEPMDDKNDDTTMQTLESYFENDLFENVPSDVCLKIMSYLDPISFSKLASTNSHFYKYSRSQQANQYFKILCLAQFRSEPTLPLNCVFTQIQDYVLTHPLEFGQNFRNAVNNNLRYFVWKMEAQSFKVQKQYYKFFNSYRSLFLQCPRINYNGFYVCKQRYVKVGEKTYKNPVTPIHVIYYYRYFRFFEDGSLLYYVSSKKHSPAKIKQHLSYDNRLNLNNDNIMIGQFMQHKDKVYIKSANPNTIFSYQMNIISNQHKISDKLKVMRYTLEVVDEKEVIQQLFVAKPFKEQLCFFYSYCQQMAQENKTARARCGV